MCLLVKLSLDGGKKRWPIPERKWKVKQQQIFLFYFWEHFRQEWKWWKCFRCSLGDATFQISTAADGNLLPVSAGRLLSILLTRGTLGTTNEEEYTH